jgi:hypothetical protein
VLFRAFGFSAAQHHCPWVLILLLVVINGVKNYRIDYWEDELGLSHSLKYFVTLSKIIQVNYQPRRFRWT